MYSRHVISPKLVTLRTAVRINYAPVFHVSPVCREAVDIAGLEGMVLVPSMKLLLLTVLPYA